MTKKSIQTYKTTLIAVITLFMLSTGCDDRFDPRGGNPSGEGEQVDVTLSIGLEDEADGYELPGTPATKTGADRDAAFSFDLLPSAQTKTETSLKPDALYNLEIRQYKDDTHKAGAAYDRVDLGTKISVNLMEVQHCQLVLVAWGEGNGRRLGTGNLSAVQDTIGSYLINDLKPEDQADMNKMPYVLHLKDVNVSKDGRIYSQDGEAIDIRLRLQRLAARLTFSWDYKVDGYTPQQILIHSIPTLYKVVASPDEKDNTYPSLLDQFRTIQLANNAATGSYSCWIPANVRGSNPAATSEAYRIKSNAPTGSSYIRFIAVNASDDKKKLDYRIYLGGKETTDFNLYGNRDYSYKATFSHSSTDLPVGDLRVTIVDPIPASEGNNNFVPTANCFMVAPGGAFCFNPYKYTVEGKPVDNTLLQGWCPTGTRIQSVRVLWQTLENGDVGDPVLGRVNSSADHENIVDLKNGGSFADARIYCRVAPNTTGGSGLIAAYASKDGSGDPLWSWHIWVTDYAPDATANASVDEPNKRVQKYTYGGKTQYPMMDRNLGANAGYTDVPATMFEKAKANGFHYQWGRKDPFPGSYSGKKEDINIVLKNNEPTPGMLNLYQPDGISFYIRKYVSSSVPVQTTFRNPTTVYQNGAIWCSSFDTQFWNDAQNRKTVYDPCPAGWRVASKAHYRAFFKDTEYEQSSSAEKKPMNVKNASSILDDGGVVLYFENQSSGRSTFLRLTGYQETYNGFHFIGGMAVLSCREAVNGNATWMFSFVQAYFNYSGFGGQNILGNWSSRDAHTLRCIQDR